MIEAVAETLERAWACEAQACATQVTAAELLDLTDRLVAAGRYQEAQPGLQALKSSGKFPAEVAFLSGYLAADLDDLESAEREYRRALSYNPTMTRARLELARVLSATQKPQQADYHYRRAQADRLSPDVAAAVETSRKLLRDRQRVGFEVALGLTPDSNPSSSTDATVVDLHLGSQVLPAALSDEAKAKPALGVLTSAAVRWREPASENASIVLEGAARAIEYPASDRREHALNLGLGAEVWAAERLRLTAMAEVGGHEFSGSSQTSVGGRLIAEHTRPRTAIVISARVVSVNAPDTPGAEGLEYSTAFSAHYAAAPRTTLVLRLYGVRRELTDPALAGRELGVGVDWARDFQRGLTTTASMEASTYRADGATPIFGPKSRRDERVSLRVGLNSRAFTWRGFSPALTYSYTHNHSNLPIYAYARNRFSIELSRVF